MASKVYNQVGQIMDQKDALYPNLAPDDIAWDVVDILTTKCCHAKNLFKSQQVCFVTDNNKAYLKQYTDEDIGHIVREEGIEKLFLICAHHALKADVFQAYRDLCAGVRY